MRGNMKHPVNIANHALKLIKEKSDSNSLDMKGGFDDAWLGNESGLMNCGQLIPLITKFQQIYPLGCAGLHFGQSQTFSTWGRLGYTIMTSETLYDAVEIALKYQKTMARFVDIDFKYLPTGQTEMTISSLINDENLRVFGIESTLASMLSIYSQLTKENIGFTRIDFSYDIEEYSLKEYKRYFKCELNFNCSETKAYISTPKNRNLETFDIANFNMFLGKLIERHKEVSSDDLVLSIKNKLNKGDGKFASQSQIAHELNISTSLLSKRLSKIGMNYREILESVKQEIAVNQLKQPKTIKMYEIALLTGYSDISNFRKAFYRWQGTTPSNFRKINSPN